MFDIYQMKVKDAEVKRVKMLLLSLRCVLPNVTGRVLVVVGLRLGMAEQHILPETASWLIRAERSCGVERERERERHRRPGSRGSSQRGFTQWPNVRAHLFKMLR